jgi:hypothetical protein
MTTSLCVSHLRSQLPWVVVAVAAIAPVNRDWQGTRLSLNHELLQKVNLARRLELSALEPNYPRLRPGWNRRFSCPKAAGGYRKFPKGREETVGLTPRL